ncbi:hypothetical protein BU23DRAFT_662155 [Bimuria novae-zelandiae CBS 107.79]|uniref:Uncharacterized protein n=1 Tax=Bimuria novae-zelandiae CBS 107.79 TaxID=1447943 RepID=A0A6A5URH6_9PLEO|nr:hypothetical protein BU23DRAFT_662155 [Bimuria novae-zelandiae CBS 107.79]
MAPADNKRKLATFVDDTSNLPAKRIRPTANGDAALRMYDIFPFLKLPVELRNRVYDILAQDAEENPVSIRKADEDDKGYHFPHSGWGLTAGCSLIRREFLSVLRPRRHLLVTVADTEDYMNVFVPLLDENVPFVRTPGVIELTPGLSGRCILNRWPLIKTFMASDSTGLMFSTQLEVAKRIYDSLSSWKGYGHTGTVRGWLADICITPSFPATSTAWDGPSDPSINNKPLLAIMLRAHSTGIFSPLSSKNPGIGFRSTQTNRIVATCFESNMNANDFYMQFFTEEEKFYHVRHAGYDAIIVGIILV